MPPKKEAPKKDMVAEIGFVVIVLIFLWIMWSTILEYFLVDRFGSYANLWQVIVAKFLAHIYPVMVVLSVIISVLAIAGIAHSFKKLIAINKELEKKYGSSSGEDKAVTSVLNKNDRWEHAIAHLNSANSGDWRLAIIEADVMLDEMLRAMGYHGDSIGDILKGVDKSDMLTLDNAWEAHKIRNKIVHSASEYDLTEREAKRIMTLYESVFREFKII